jgi:hypothetical protein
MYLIKVLIWNGISLKCGPNTLDGDGDCQSNILTSIPTQRATLRGQPNSKILRLTKTLSFAHTNVIAQFNLNAIF